MVGRIYDESGQVLRRKSGKGGVWHHSYRGKDYAQQSEHGRRASVDEVPIDEIATDET